MKLKDSFFRKYPLTLSNGFIGLGKSLSPKAGVPYFFIKEFNSTKEECFQPEYYIPSHKFKGVDQENIIVSKEDSPSEGNLMEEMNTFLREDNGLEKIVLARRRCYTFKEKIDPQGVIKKLIECFPKENAFAYCPHPNKLFFGSSPERLYSRENQKIIVDCIAGTAKVKEEEGLFSEKNKNEHNFVTNYVEEVLKEIATEIKISPLGVKNAKNLIHLYQTVEGRLKPEITDLEIILKLHPTPAVLGFPKKEALSFLKQQEKFDRGYYAGCLGWMLPNKSLLQVGIRSGWVENNTLTLFAGAGITKDSDPELEIIEINNKFKTLEEVFLDFALQA